MTICENEPANRGERYPAEVLSRGEVEAMLRATGRGCIGKRDRALIVCLWRGGLRVSEALALKRKDIDLEQGTIRVLHGKGDQARTVGIDPQACAVLVAWMAELRRFHRGPIFCSLKGEPLNASHVRRLLPRLASKAGIDKRVHPHGLRHTHAAELAAEGHPVNLIQAQLGHASLATTDRYLRHIAPRELVEAMRERSGWSEG